MKIQEETTRWRKKISSSLRQENNVKEIKKPVVLPVYIGYCIENLLNNKEEDRMDQEQRRRKKNCRYMRVSFLFSSIKD